MPFWCDGLRVKSTGALVIAALLGAVVLVSIASTTRTATSEEPVRDKTPEALQKRLEKARAAADTFAPAEVGGAGDTVYDVPFCQGDITAVAADNELDHFVIGSGTVCNSNPYSDASWTIGRSAIVWSIDVNGDGDDDYQVFYSNVFGLYAHVYYTGGGAFTQTCEATPGWDGANFFSATFANACIGSPPSVRIQAFMLWDENPFGTCVCYSDVAPNGFGYSSPISRGPVCSATTAAPGANTVPFGGQAFTPLAPARIYDTRTGVGGTNGLPLGAGRTSTVQVTGVGGVPATGVSAVVLNLTATAGTQASYLSVTPMGGNSTSSVNFVPDQDVPNLVTVPVAADGNVRVFNAAGCAHVVIDVFGYYGSSATARFNAVDPARVLDTRTGNGTGVVGPLGPGQTLALQVTDRGGVPAGATAAVLNVTATGADAASYLAVTPFGGNATSNVNVLPGQDRPNLVTVPLSPDGTIRVYNGQGNVHVVADVMGWYGPTGSLFTTVAPARLVDTRTGLGGLPGPLGPAWTVAAQVTGLAGVPDGADAVLLNLTATAASAATYLAVSPQGGAGTSNLNVLPGQDVANAVAVKVAEDWPWVRLHNAAGTVDAVLDVVGWFLDSPV